MSEIINVQVLASLIAREMHKTGHISIPRLMDLENAATYLGMSSDALKTKALQGKVPGVKIDKKWRFDRVDLDRWIEDHKRTV
jgi:excisionase family DNA binding protein